MEPNWPQLMVFMAAWLTVCAGVIYLSGHLPIAVAPRPVQEGAGPLLVWLNVLTMGGLAIVSILFAVAYLKWTSIIVSGGIVFLFAPFIVQDLPLPLKDTQAGLAVLLVVGAIVLAGVYVAGVYLPAHELAGT